MTKTKLEFFKSTSLGEIEFFQEGETYYQKYLELIEGAQMSIHLQTYIFEPDEFGKSVKSSLIRATQRGVKIYALVDRIGSTNLTDDFVNEMTSAGIHFCTFNSFQFKWLWQWGRRLHHKILLVDGFKSIIGGINVVSSTFGLKNQLPQLDFAVHLQGPVNENLSRYCQFIFQKSCGKPLSFSNQKRPAAPPKTNEIKLKISINDWFRGRRQIAKQYSWLMRNAKKDIIIINSYFFPRRKLMRQLRNAVRRGVRVRLILPKFSDWPIYVFATQYLYSYFLKNGVEVYQWNKSILHGKLASIDGRFSTIGSFNLNYTSYQQNLEMNVEVDSEEFTKDLNKKIDLFISEGCEKIDESVFILKAKLGERMLRYFSFLVLSFIASFSIVLSFQASNRKVD